MPSSTKNLEGLSIVAFESRMELPLQRLIEKHGGTALPAPALKEIPLENNTQAFHFFEELKKGNINYLVLMTGVATRTLLATLETKFSKEEIHKELSTKTKIVVRGPKPKAVCTLNNIPMAYIVKEPNTWREILATLDTVDVGGKKITVLEYGVSNDEFLNGLKKKGALVSTLQVYSWALPDDLNPLNKAIDEILAGRVDFCLFTTQVHVDHVLQVVRQRNEELAFRRALHRVGIASIGPVCSENLRDNQIFPDCEANPNKNDALINLVAEKGKEILDKKRKRADEAQVWRDYPHLDLKTKDQGPETRDQQQKTRENIFLNACHRQPNKKIPVWLMRQAGRYMAEYHLSRSGMEFLDFCKNSDRAAEATLTAIERLNVDAAIIFADILLILEPMGLKLDYKKGEGPVIANPVRVLDDIAALQKVNVKESLSYVVSAIKKVRSHMDPQIPLIGFCGAPFTVASYMIEGRSPKNSILTKRLMHEHPEAWNQLLDKITVASIDYLNEQINAGAEVIQIFDSWIGQLNPSEYSTYVAPHSKKLIQGVKKGIPVIHFGTETASLLPLMKKTGGDVIGIDWHCDIEAAWDQLGNDVAVQGNLDPLILFSKPEVIFREAEKILKSVGHRPGFIFNLGHGILPETPVDNVMALVDFVHAWRKN